MIRILRKVYNKNNTSQSTILKNKQNMAIAIANTNTLYVGYMGRGEVFFGVNIKNNANYIVDVCYHTLQF